MSDVSLVSVSKSFGAAKAVSDMSVDIKDGEFVVLLGPTGAGKTTTLRLIAGLESADSGDIIIDGERMNAAGPSERDVAFVFQQYSLYPHLSVFENLAFPLRSPARKMPQADIDARVRKVAAMVRIDHKLENKSTKLSGGEMQRVAIGRALVRDPAIFLMDEPLSSLDAKLRGDLRLELKRIQADIGATLLYVTHDQIEAMTMADRIGILSEGRLVQIGAPREIYERPSNLYVAQRLGQPHINVLPPGLLPVQSAPAAAAHVGARTEHIMIEIAGSKSAAEKAAANATIDWIEHLGDQIHLHMIADGRKIVSLADPFSPFKAGDAVKLTLRSPLFFDAAGARIG